jgi:hypothetical protein
MEKKREKKNALVFSASQSGLYLIRKESIK